MFFFVSIFSILLKAQLDSPEFCGKVLAISNIKEDGQEISSAETYNALHNFFSHKNIHDYTDAAIFGKNHNYFDNPELLNNMLARAFVQNSADVCPNGPRNYQAIIFNTSGIDVFMERLAFVSRLIKKKQLQADELIALVGTHAHRDDLKEVDYLLGLPELFNHDFDLKDYDKQRALEKLNGLLQKNKWIHRDGMQAALSLIECDADMAALKNSTRFYSGEGGRSLRTEELLENLKISGLKKPVSSENPIAFISNAQGASKLQEMIKKTFSNVDSAIDILVSRPVSPEIEATLFRDTPQQRAMVKLFHFYRILETGLKEKQTKVEAF